jgi:Fe-S-cluster-containing dehydrogenase component/DMSO reductase anchor subunit
MTPSQARGFLFDLNLCTGCHACELACSTENGLEWGTSWRQVVSYNGPRIPSIASYHLSLACNHCSDAPCLAGCPALAIRRDEGTGAVLIDGGACMGCAYCGWACPYDALRFDDAVGVMAKCTWCHQRLAEGLDPACVERCPTSALGFGGLSGEAVVPGFPDTPAEPAIRFTPLRPERRAPETTWELPAEIVRSFEAARPAPSRSISLSGEWSLMLFTLLVTGLAGWILAAQGAAGPPHFLLFVATAGLAAAAAALHLGRKGRMWRAILNVRRSWLSREILCFTLFCAAALLHLILPGLPVLGVTAAALGLLTLFSMDRVYDPVRPPGPRVHSADTLLTGALVGFLLVDQPVLSTVVVLMKLVLYVARFGRERGSPAFWLVRGPRLLGLLLTIPLAVLAPGPVAPAAWVALLVGEVIDRAQFYEALRITSPHRAAAAHLERARARVAQAL